MPRADKSASGLAPLRSRETGGKVPGTMEKLIHELHPLYTECVRPLEEMYNFDIFRPSWYEETILNERPFVTLFGPWSAGKTTFINYLLQKNYLWTGPQPTTAEFTVVMYGKEAGPIDGQALANAMDLPFKGLLEFGESFVNNLKGFQVPHPLLERVTLIDTPGVLESAVEVHKRKYDYVKVCRWFAERSDLIFVLFDPSKLDAGAELRQLFRTSFKGIENRIRLVLNKADTISTQELMRVYGSLFWNLSNFINTTEPPRVYVGSFWDQPYNPDSFALLFAEEKVDLLHELLEVIPQQAKDKKVTSLIRRAKEVLVHAAIVGGMRADLPAVFGKSKAQRKMIEGLPHRFERIAARFKLNHRDFPPVSAYEAFFQRFDVENFPPLQKAEKAGLIHGLQELIGTTLPAMLRPVPHTKAADPFFEEERAALQNMYRDHVRHQYSGSPGIQGSTDLVASTVRRILPSSAPPSTSPTNRTIPGTAPEPSDYATTVPRTASYSQPTTSVSSPAKSPAALPISSPQPPLPAASAAAPPPPAAPSPADMQAMMMMMMQQMMAQQQPPPPPPQQQQQQQQRQLSGSSDVPATTVQRRSPPTTVSSPPNYPPESSVPPTPQEMDSDNDGGPPTEAVPGTSTPFLEPGKGSKLSANMSKSAS